MKHHRSTPLQYRDARLAEDIMISIYDIENEGKELHKATVGMYVDPDMGGSLEGDDASFDEKDDITYAFNTKGISSQGLPIGYFGFAFLEETFFIWILFALYGIYSAATEGISKAWVSDLVPDERRGTAIGLLTMLSSFAIMLGSFTAGVLWDEFGSTVPFLISALVSLIIGIVILAVRKT